VGQARRLIVVYHPDVLRRLTIPGVLLMCVLMERGAYYGVRAQLIGFLMGPLGLASEDAIAIYRTLTLGTAVAPLLGGFVAVAAGPRITMTVGALLYAVGYGALGLGSTGTASAGVWLVVLGSGLFRPAVFVALAHELGHPREHARVAVFALAYVAVNVAAFGATVASGRGGGDSFALVSAGSAAAMVVVTLLGGVTVGLHHAVGEKPVRPPFGARPELGALVLFVLTMPFYLGISGQAQLVSLTAATVEHGYETLETVMTINPAVVIVVASLLAVAAGVGAALDAPPLALWIVAGGMIVHALGLGLSVLAQPSDVPSLLPSVIVTAIAEPLVAAVLLSRVTADTHPRFATLLYAGWLALTGLLGQAVSVVDDFDTCRIVLAALAVAALLSGAVVAALAIPMQRRLFTPRAADDAAEP
jgi:dipeptide/tripeptide permease